MKNKIVIRENDEIEVGAKGTSLSEALCTLMKYAKILEKHEKETKNE